MPTQNFFGFVSGQPRLEYNTNGGSTFIDASGEIVSITLPDNERAVGAVNVLDSDYPLLAAGKIAAGTMRIRGVYTGASSGFWFDVNNAYHNGTPLFFRYYPAGSAAGRWRYSSGTNAVGSAASATGGHCYVMSRPVPAVDSNDLQLYTYEVEIMCPGFTGGSL